MWRLEKNPEHIRREYTTDNPIRLARDVLVGEYEQKPHMLNFKPLCIISRGHSGSRCLSWIVANLHYYFGKTYNLSGDSYHTTPEIRRIQNVTDQMHDTIISTVNKYLQNRHYQLPVEKLLELYRDDINRLTDLFNEHFLRNYDPDKFAGWCWKDTDSYIIFPIFYEMLKPHDPLVLHLIRDGRDIAFKIHRTDSAVEAPGPALMEVLGYNQDTPQHIRAAASWAFQVDQFLNWPKIGDIMEIYYEDLCAHPRQCIRQICERLHIPEMLYEPDTIAKPIYRDRISQYRDHSPSAIAKVQSLIGETLEKLGYIL